ncbi:MAG TPA: TonB-dependent receptor [Candidatus Limnocylindria bacterium]|nr:TonB-dependent receptor [Candidatus Limnocylindria bacterium]
MSQSIFLATLGAAVPGASSPPARLAPVIVTGTNEVQSLTSPSMDEAARQRHEVSGGFTLKSTEDLERGRASGFQDLFRGVPGLILQGESGTEIGEISVRGSGVLSDGEPVGIQILQDGFAFNQGDGETILEDIDLASVKYAEVFRGANAFKYGSTTLGGAINMVSRTGYDARPIELRMEGGSYGFLRGNAVSGGVEGDFDYFASITGRRLDGFRAHSREDTEDLFANVGWKITEHIENRVFLTLARTDRLLPGGLTQDQLNNDPKYVDPESIEANLSKEWQYMRVADRVTYQQDNIKIDGGAYWWHRNLLSRGLFEDESWAGIQSYYSDNVGIRLDLTVHNEWFGRENRLTLGVAPAIEREVDQNFENLDGQRGETTARDTELSVNAPIYLEDQQYITEKLSLQLGVQAIYAQRHFHDLFVDTDSGDQSGNLVFRGLNPKVGAIYEFDPHSQVFANFSKSWQPPTFDNLVAFGDEVDDSLLFTPLQAQRAWTAEVGTRGEKGRFGWELALYHSWVRNELLEIKDANGVEHGAFNIDRSYHQGIEAGLEVELLDSVFTRRRGSRAADRLVFEQSYTLTDLHFDGDPVYGNNRIAIIPIHLYDAGLTYIHRSGFYAGPNLRCNITSYPVDHANTLYADAYALWGFRAGFQSRQGWSVYVEARNLGDVRYASDIEAIPDARTAGDDVKVFHPGDGRAFYAGVSWSL